MKVSTSNTPQAQLVRCVRAISLACSMLLCASICLPAYADAPRENELSAASKAAQEKWAFCVFRHADSFAPGPDEVRAVVETASGLCELDRFAWLGLLGADNLNADFMASYTDSLTKSVKNGAASIVLKRRAAGR